MEELQKGKRTFKATIDHNQVKKSSSPMPNMICGDFKNTAIHLRRSARLRQKSLRSSETIQSTRTKQLDSQPQYDDEAHLRNIFPEEVWCMILDHLQDPTALENLSNSSSFLRHLLLPRRVIFLFPKTWKIFSIQRKYDNYVMLEVPYWRPVRWEVCEYSGVTEIADSSNNRGKPNQKCPAEVLKLRLVCQTWCEAIDSSYRDHPRHLEFEEIHDGNPIKSVSWMDIDLNNGKFFLHFHHTHGGEGTSRSPFISRKASLECEFGSEHVYRFGRIPRTSLSKFGQHIWYMDIILKGQPNGTIMDCYYVLREVLQSLPNIKVLRIKYSDFYFRSKDTTPVSTIEEAIRLQPLPALKHLQFLSEDELPLPIFRSIILKNLQISKISLAKKLYLSPFIDAIKTPLQTLSELFVRITGETEFEMLRHLTWALNKLHLRFENWFFIEWVEIFRLIEKFGAVLTDLVLKLPEVKDKYPLWGKLEQKTMMKKCRSIKLNLPRIKHFKVTLPDMFSLDFILPMKDTLEVLDVQCSFEFRCSKLALEVEKNQIIQFLGYMHRPEESNIWSIFHKLKTYRIYDKDSSLTPEWSCTREEWRLKKCEAQKEEEL